MAFLLFIACRVSIWLFLSLDRDFLIFFVSFSIAICADWFNFTCVWDGIFFPSIVGGFFLESEDFDACTFGSFKFFGTGNDEFDLNAPVAGNCLVIANDVDDENCLPDGAGVIFETFEVVGKVLLDSDFIVALSGFDNSSSSAA